MSSPSRPHRQFSVVFKGNVLVCHHCSQMDIVVSVPVFLFFFIGMQLLSNISFCCATLGLSPMYASVPSSLRLTPSPPTPGHHRVAGWAPCAAQQPHWLAAVTRGCVRMSVPLSPLAGLSFPHCAHKSLYICVSIPALQVG